MIKSTFAEAKSRVAWDAVARRMFNKKLKDLTPEERRYVKGYMRRLLGWHQTGSPTGRLTNLAPEPQNLPAKKEGA